MKKEIYKAGDVIEITPQIWVKFDLWARKSMPIGIKGKLFAQRLDRRAGQLAVEWEFGHRTNVIALEGAGLKFEKPKFELLSIKYCPIDFLTPTELVVRGLIETENLSENAATKKVESIRPAMEKYGIVFYEP